MPSEVSHDTDQNLIRSSSFRRLARDRRGPSEMTMQVIPTGAALGAEIRGLDFSRPLQDDDKAALRKAWAEHLVLLFRGQTLTDEQLLQASGVFGPPHEAASRKYHLDV